MGRPQPLVDGTAVVSEEKQEMRIWTRKRRPGEDRPVRPPVGFPPGRTLGSPVYPPSGGISGSHGVTNYGPIAMPHGPTPPQARNDRRNHLTRGRDTPGGNREAGLPAPVPWSGTTKRNEDAGRGTQSCDQALLPWIQVLRTPYCVVGYCRVRPRPSILAVRCAPNSRPSLVNRLVSWGGARQAGSREWDPRTQAHACVPTANAKQGICEALPLAIRQTAPDTTAPQASVSLVPPAHPRLGRTTGDSAARRRPPQSPDCDDR